MQNQPFRRKMEPLAKLVEVITQVQNYAKTRFFAEKWLLQKFRSCLDSHSQ